MLYRNRYRVPSARKVGWDYRWSGYYGVTICVRDRVPCLSEISGGIVTLTPLGEVVATAWREIPAIHPRVSLDEWVIMPDHLHGILLFDRHEGGTPAPTLGTIIGQFKKRSTKRIWSMQRSGFAWQERYDDRILPNARALENFRSYIRRNPHKHNSP